MMMEKMTKKDIVEMIAEEFDSSKAHADRCVNYIFDVIARELCMGKEVSIPGFGKFVVVQRKARDGVNPQTQAKIRIPASKTVKFKVSKKLKDVCNS